MGGNWWWSVLVVVVVVGVLLGSAILVRNRSAGAAVETEEDRAEPADGTAAAAAGEPGPDDPAVPDDEGREDAAGRDAAPGDAALTDVAPADDAGPATGDDSDGDAAWGEAGEPGWSTAEPGTDATATVPGGLTPDADSAATGAGPAPADRPGAVDPWETAPLPELDHPREAAAAEVDPVDASREPAASAGLNGSGPTPDDAVDPPPAADRVSEPESTDPEPPARPAPEPADSALAALDSGFMSRTASFGVAAAAVSAASEPVPESGPYEGSVRAAADGSAPSAEHTVKVHEGSGRYHTPESPFYVRTRGDLWFRTPEQAEAAGFTAWNAKTN